MGSKGSMGTRSRRKGAKGNVSRGAKGKATRGKGPRKKRGAHVAWGSDDKVNLQDLQEVGRGANGLLSEGKTCHLSRSTQSHLLANALLCFGGGAVTTWGEHLVTQAVSSVVSNAVQRNKQAEQDRSTSNDTAASDKVNGPVAPTGPSYEAMHGVSVLACSNESSSTGEVASNLVASDSSPLFEGSDLMRLGWFAPNTNPTDRSRSGDGQSSPTRQLQVRAVEKITFWGWR
jgi:hypothetical protein